MSVADVRYHRTASAVRSASAARLPIAGRGAAGVAVLLLATALAIVCSLTIGSRVLEWSTVVAALTAPDTTSVDHVVVTDLRLPRTALGLLAGAALGVAGAVMQGLTRNPLADPGLLGINAGAAFGVVLASRTLDLQAPTQLVWFAFVGAAVAAIAVYALGAGGRGGATPTRLIIAGAAVSALLHALTRGVVVLDHATIDRFRFWTVGSLLNRQMEVGTQLAPFVIVGLLLALALGRSLNALALGEEAARALGTNVGATRAAAAGIVTLLCGAAVAAVGPIAFVGLVVPHAARFWFGPDLRWLVPASALVGAVLLLACDTAGRVVAGAAEVQVGIMVAAVGGPLFIALVRRGRLTQL